MRRENCSIPAPYDGARITRRQCCIFNLAPQEEERLELFNRHVRSGAATPFDVPLPYTGASGPEVRQLAPAPRCRCLLRALCAALLRRCRRQPRAAGCPGPAGGASFADAVRGWRAPAAQPGLESTDPGPACPAPAAGCRPQRRHHAHDAQVCLLGFLRLDRP